MSRILLRIITWWWHPKLSLNEDQLLQNWSNLLTFLETGGVKAASCPTCQPGHQPSGQWGAHWGSVWGADEIGTQWGAGGCLWDAPNHLSSALTPAGFICFYKATVLRWGWRHFSKLKEQSAIKELPLPQGAAKTEHLQMWSSSALSVKLGH